MVSARALSWESPTLPTEGSTPASARRSVYLMDTYWLPLSLWCTSPPRWTGRRSCSACIEHKACMRRARGPPAHNPARIGVDHEGDVDKAGPGRHIGEVGEPENVRPWHLELAVDVIQRAWRSLVADRGLDGFAADHPHVAHQPRHCATG